MTFAFGVLTLILALETLLLYALTQQIPLVIIPWGMLGIFVCLQFFFPTVTSRIKTVLALIMLLGVLILLPLENKSVHLVVYAVFMHFMAWTIGYEGYLGKRPPVRVVNLPRNPRNAWLYTEAFWPTLLTAYIAIDQRAVMVFAEQGRFVGYALLILAFLFWEHGRRISSADEAVPHRTREIPISPLIVSVAIFIGAVLLAAQPVARVLPRGVELMQQHVETWMQNRHKSKEQQLAEQMLQQAQRSGSQESREGGQAGQNIGFNETPQLPKRSKLGSTHTQDIFLEIPDHNARAFIENMQIYLRGTTLAHYRTNQWFPRRIIGTWYEDSDDQQRDGRVTLNDNPPFSVRHTVYLNQAKNRTLLAMPGMSHIMMNRLYEAADNWYVFPDSESLKVTYTADSSYYTFERLPPGSRNLGQADVAYYEIPEEPLMPDIANLANQIAHPAASPEQKISSYKNYLRNNYQYTREVVNPNNLPPLENFLFEERRGYCDFYATSLTLMLRTQGIPSRLAVGYSGGTYDAERGVYTFYSDNAHSWTEVFFEDYGWVIVDATPPDVTTPQAASPEETAAAPDLESFEDIGENVEEDEASVAFAAPTWLDRFWDALQNVVPYLLGALLLFLVLIVLTVVRNKGKRASAKTNSTTEPQLSFYLEIKKLLAQAGYPNRPAYTPAEYKMKLKHRGMEHPAVDELTEYVYAVNYCQQPRDRDRERTFVHEIKALLKNEVV